MIGMPAAETAAPITMPAKKVKSVRSALSAIPSVPSA